MRQLVTTAIVLSRTDYGEADRILTLLTPDQGKLTLLAKGVRRVKSKLAGGIELFSVSTITFIRGRGEVGTLVSARLDKHYQHIVEDLDRTMLGYDLIKFLHKNTEDEPEAAYFDLLERAFEALDDASVTPELIRFWFAMKLLQLAGHTPNLYSDSAGRKLEFSNFYYFDYENMSFSPTTQQGGFTETHIKFMRIAVQADSPGVLRRIQGSANLVRICLPFITTLKAKL